MSEISVPNNPRLESIDSPSALEQFLTAFAATMCVFAPTFTIFQLRNVQPAYGHYRNRLIDFLNALDGWAICLLVIGITILVIAAPVERAYAGKSSSLKMALRYLIGFLVIGVISVGLVFVTGYPTNTLFIAVAVFCFVAGVIGFTARGVYAVLISRPKFSAVVNILAVGLAVIGLLIPNQSPTGSGAVGYFKDRTPGELARATILNGAKPQTPGMIGFHSKKGSVVGQTYDLVIGCQQRDVETDLLATVRNRETHEVIKSSAFTCHAGTGVETQVGQIAIPKTGTHVSVTLKSTQPSAGLHLPLAFAAVAKTGLPW